MSSLRVCCVATLALLSVFGSTAASLAAQQQPLPGLAKDYAQRRQVLISANGLGTNAVLRKELLEMRSKDMNARGVSGTPGSTPIQVASNLTEIDAKLTAELKQIVKDNGWPTITLVGLDASDAAMTVLAHTQDTAWRRTLLPMLEDLADGRRIDGSLLALVIDKELVAEGRLQRYGTQLKNVDGELAMFGVEDPAELDKRRGLVGLAPEADYEQQMATLYRFKLSKKIVSAPTPVAK